MIIRDIELEEVNAQHSLKEMEINSMASDYIAEHYNSLVEYARKLGIKSKSEDLIMDVYIATKKNENNGKSYDVSYNGEFTSVKEFILKRIKGYSKNSKYSDDVANYNRVNVKRIVTEEVVAVDSCGRIRKKNGQAVTKKVQVTKIDNVEYREFSASCDDHDEYSNMSDIQKGLAFAGGVDKNLTIIEDILSIKKYIEICIDICEIHGINILNVFKNIDEISRNINIGVRTYVIPESFKKLSELAFYNEELGEALRNVLNYSMNNKEHFNEIISQY